MIRFIAFFGLLVWPLAWQANAVDFAHQIVPILKTHCVQCHGGEEAEGGFSLNTRALFLESDAAVPRKAAESHFLQLIKSTDPDTMMPPADQPRVSKEQQELLNQWVNEGMRWEPGFSFGKPRYQPPFRPRRPELPKTAVDHQHPVDQWINHYLSEHQRPALEPASDAVFLRRVYLDLVGLMPTAEQAKAFLDDKSPDKRTKLIDQLLADNLGYTEHWLTFWNDLLRNDYDGTGFITGGRTQISRWLYDALLANKPFDQMVRELIAPTNKESAGFINGIKWRGTVSAGQTLPIQFSQSVSQSFLGINMKCASCHDSFIARWTLKDAYGLAAIYSDQPLELHRCDKPTGDTAQATWLFPEIGQIDPQANKQERLKQLANLMVHPENGRVPRTIVNRLWGQLMGRGIVHPLDAMQTEPWYPELLDYLAADFQDNGYDLKRTIRLIATSQAYQSRSEAVQQPDAPVFEFQGPNAKRLTAEQFRDIVWQITNSAPGSFDAPIQRGIVAPELAKELSFASTWIWGSSVDKGAPAAGEKVLLWRSFQTEKPIEKAAIVAAVDNAYTLYLNGKKVLSGGNWQQLQVADLTKQVKADGENQIVIVAENQGSTPNLAAAFCAIWLRYEDGSVERLATDESWSSSLKVPPGSGKNKWNPKLANLQAEPARVLDSSVWKNTVDPQIGPALVKVATGQEFPVRAALLKADDFMRTLGRPNRDQIVTSRPSELTTLEALSLATNEQLMKELQHGAQLMLDLELKPSELIDHIYLTVLTRYPTSNEKQLVVKHFADQADVSSISDVIWALLMSPEFQVVR
jgi:hypothetical protein